MLHLLDGQQTSRVSHLSTLIQLTLNTLPHSSALKYKLSIWFFAILTLYMLACAGVCVWRVLQSTRGPMYDQMLLSLLATFGMYFLASALALDPWHLVTCFLQYLLLAPAYINVLNIYAFANIDDVRIPLTCTMHRSAVLTPHVS